MCDITLCTVSLHCRISYISVTNLCLYNNSNNHKIHNVNNNSDDDDLCDWQVVEIVCVCGLCDWQVVEDGYEFFAKRQLVTLFSAPNYCGEFDNAGAMMSVDETLMCSFQVSSQFLSLSQSQSLSLSHLMSLSLCHSLYLSQSESLSLCQSLSQSVSVSVSVSLCLHFSQESLS